MCGRSSVFSVETVVAKGDQVAVGIPRSTNVDILSSLYRAVEPRCALKCVHLPRTCRDADGTSQGLPQTKAHTDQVRRAQ